MIKISPSMLAADFGNLREQISQIEKAGAEMLHVDIMDGHFVPNITIGPQVVADIHQETKLLLDIHLMIEQPQLMIPAFAEAGAHIITVHLEACPHLNRVVNQIKDLGLMAGVALNPTTPVGLLEDIIDEIDLLLLMTVNPGFGGQQFIPSSIKKINKARQMLAPISRPIYLEVDGGINAEIAKAAIKAGANVLVAGSYIFGSASPEGALQSLKVINTGLDR